MLINTVYSLGYLGLFIVMFLAGFCAPISWELIPVGASDLNPIISSLACSLGSSFGAVLGYLLGKYLGRPLIIKYGKYLFANHITIEKAEKWIHKWGHVVTLICRSIQYLPYKTLNIVADILSMNFHLYAASTVLGSIIRCGYMIYWKNNII